MLSIVRIPKWYTAGGLQAHRRLDVRAMLGLVVVLQPTQLVVDVLILLSSLTAQLAFRVPTTIARTSARTALDRKVVAAAGIGSGNRHVQEFSGYGASLYVRRYSCSHSNDRCRLIAGVHARRVRQTAYS